MSRQTVTFATIVTGVLVAAAAIAAAIATAAAETSPMIDACRNLRHGLVRIVFDAGSCKKNEAHIGWNSSVQKGDTGPEGPAGPAGPPGPQGAAGSGMSSVSDLRGTSCTTFDGATGHVEVGATATDLITLTCETDGSAPPGAGTAHLVINEVDYDQVGADTGGFVEILNTGSVAAALEGVALVLVNGGDGTEYARKALTGTLAAGARITMDVDPQNGAPDGIALIDTGTGALLDALSYEGAITAATVGGKTYDLVEGTVLPVEVADSNTQGGALARIPDGADTGNAAADWVFTTTATKGTANVKSP